ncbi:acetoacetate decarboxylase [Streptomyces rugosispiralis]|uniref:Acetoacetate decarboxylase n=1 Tax=Streptomyces rugosispiralis TaxID=2967341 RepID=A0ABT1UPA1_9ACTN|nr:acetoacetate decarboxylase [Streptomyces rugosispiralis]MCQ8186955.1 acetoacetate decarboxylase [Streptomyces rugosispiralis]
MDIGGILRTSATPVSGPAYPHGPYRFLSREYLNITYRTDPDAMRAVVPEPLEVGEPLVRFEVIRMPDSSGLGNYTESGQVLRVRHQGEPADYIHCMYLDNGPAISLGREASAYPKKLGKPRLYTDSDTLVGTLDYGSLRVATATMGFKHTELSEREARAEIAAPTYMLKVLPGYDGAPRICELVCSRITDLTVRGAWTGPARLQLFEHALAPLADLPVLDIVKATHVLTDLTLPRAEIAHDYLAQPHDSRTNTPLSSRKELK